MGIMASKFLEYLKNRKIEKFFSVLKDLMLLRLMILKNVTKFSLTRIILTKMK